MTQAEWEQMKQRQQQQKIEDHVNDQINKASDVLFNENKDNGGIISKDKYEIKTDNTRVEPKIKGNN